MQVRTASLRSGRGVKAAQLVGARVNFVGGENFVDDGHGGESLAKEKRVGSG